MPLVARLKQAFAEHAASPAVEGERWLLSYPTHGPKLVERRRRGLALTTSADPSDMQVLKAMWHTFLAELADADMHTKGVDAVLIHSRGAARGAGVWRHAATNGFDPSHFASLGVVPIDCDHYDLRSAAAPRVAEIVDAAHANDRRILA